LVRDEHSLWSVQEALRVWVQLGIVETRSVGRATLHSLNAAHAAIAPLRVLADPVALLIAAIGEHVDPSVQAVILYGSIARGQAKQDSDIDLAVIATSTWDQRAEMQDTVRSRLGNDCDVLAFTAARFRRLSASGEPVVADILRDGVALIGSMPRVRRGVA
jgi:Nucleotidyltransferase domain.